MKNKHQKADILLPRDIEIEILARLPVKSLMRFKCVCKTWKSTIENDPSFIALQFAHANAHPSLARILISFTGNNHLYTYSASLDRGGPATPHLTLPYCETKPCWVSESFNGLVCYYNKADVYICNPCTRQFRTLPRIWTGSNYLIYPFDHQTAFSFGFHPRTNEYKVVHLLLKPKWRSEQWQNIISFETFTLHTDSTTRQVFALDTDSWKSIHSSQSFCVHTGNDEVCVNGVIYWMGKNKAYERFGVVAFDLGCEEFRFITVPIGISITFSCLTKVRGCLAFFGGWYNDFIEMWVLEEDLWIKEIFESPDLRIRKPFYSGNGYTGEVSLTAFGLYDENIMVSYHLKNRSARSIVVSGLPDWTYGYQLRFINFSITNYVECLTPLR